MPNCKCGTQINDGEYCCSSCAVDMACEGIPAETYALIDRLSKRCANTITTFPNLSRDCGEAVGTIRTIEGKIKRRDQTIVELRAELTRLRAEREYDYGQYKIVKSLWDLDVKRVLELESEIASLRTAIEAAPHSKLCSSRDGFMIFGHRCNCWKRDALDGK